MHTQKWQFGVKAGCFGWEENFAIMRNITDIEIVLFIKYVSFYFLCFYVFLCPISMTSVLMNFAIRSRDNIPIINFLSSSPLDITLCKQVLLPVFHICHY